MRRSDTKYSEQNKKKQKRKRRGKLQKQRKLSREVIFLARN